MQCMMLNMILDQKANGGFLFAVSWPYCPNPYIVRTKIVFITWVPEGTSVKVCFWSALGYIFNLCSQMSRIEWSTPAPKSNFVTSSVLSCQFMPTMWLRLSGSRFWKRSPKPFPVRNYVQHFHVENTRFYRHRSFKGERSNRRRLGWLISLHHLYTREYILFLVFKPQETYNLGVNRPFQGNFTTSSIAHSTT